MANNPDRKLTSYFKGLVDLIPPEFRAKIGLRKEVQNFGGRPRQGELDPTAIQSTVEHKTINDLEVTNIYLESPLEDLENRAYTGANTELPAYYQQPGPRVTDRDIVTEGTALPTGDNLTGESHDLGEGHALQEVTTNPAPVGSRTTTEIVDGPIGRGATGTKVRSQGTGLSVSSAFGRVLGVIKPLFGGKEEKEVLDVVPPTLSGEKYEGANTKLPDYYQVSDVVPVVDDVVDPATAAATTGANVISELNPIDVKHSRLVTSTLPAPASSRSVSEIIDGPIGRGSIGTHLREQGTGLTSTTAFGRILSSLRPLFGGKIEKETIQVTPPDLAGAKYEGSDTRLPEYYQVPGVISVSDTIENPSTVVPDEGDDTISEVSPLDVSHSRKVTQSLPAPVTDRTTTERVDGPIGRGAQGIRVRTQGSGLTFSNAFGQIFAKISPLFGGKQESDIITVTPPDLAGAKYEGANTKLPDYYQVSGEIVISDVIVAPDDAEVTTGNDVISEVRPVDVDHSQVLNTTLPAPSTSRVTSEVVDGPVGRGAVGTRTRSQGIGFSVSAVFGQVLAVVKPLFGGKQEKDVITVTPPTLTGYKFEGVETKLPDYYQNADTISIVDDIQDPATAEVDVGDSVVSEVLPVDVKHSRVVTTTYPNVEGVREVTEKIEGPIGRGALGTHKRQQGTSLTSGLSFGRILSVIRPLFGQRVERETIEVTPPALAAAKYEGVDTKLPDYYQNVGSIATADTIEDPDTVAVVTGATKISEVTPLDVSHSRLQTSTIPTPATSRTTTEVVDGPIGRGATGTRVRSQGTGLTVSSVFGQVLALVKPLFGGKQEKEVLTVTPPDLIGAKYEGDETRLPDYYTIAGATQITDIIGDPTVLTPDTGANIVSEVTPIDVKHSRKVTQTLPEFVGSRTVSETVDGPVGRGAKGTRTLTQGYDIDSATGFGKIWSRLKPLFNGRTELDEIVVTPPELVSAKYEGVNSKLPDYYQIAGSVATVDNVVVPETAEVTTGASIVSEIIPIDVSHSREVISTLPDPVTSRTTTEVVDGPIGRGAVGTRVRTQGTGLTVAAAFGQLLARISPLFGGKQEKDVITVTPPALAGKRYEGRDVALPEYYQIVGDDTISDVVEDPATVVTTTGVTTISEITPLDVKHSRKVTTVKPTPSTSRQSEALVEGPIGRGTTGTHSWTQTTSTSLSAAFGKVLGRVRPLFGGKFEQEVITLTPPTLTGGLYEGENTKLPDYYQVPGAVTITDSILDPSSAFVSEDDNVISTLDPVDVVHSRLVDKVLPTPVSSRETSEVIEGPIGRGSIGTHTWEQGADGTGTSAFGRLMLRIRPLFGSKFEKEKIEVEPPTLYGLRREGANVKLPDYYQTEGDLTITDEIQDPSEAYTYTTGVDIVNELNPIDVNHTQILTKVQPTPYETRSVDEVVDGPIGRGAVGSHTWTQGFDAGVLGTFGRILARVKPLFGGKSEIEQVNVTPPNLTAKKYEGVDTKLPDYYQTVGTVSTVDSVEDPATVAVTTGATKISEIRPIDVNHSQKLVATIPTPSTSRTVSEVVEGPIGRGSIGTHSWEQGTDATGTSAFGRILLRIKPLFGAKAEKEKVEVTPPNLAASKYEGVDTKLPDYYQVSGAVTTVDSVEDPATVAVGTGATKLSELRPIDVSHTQKLVSTIPTPATSRTTTEVVDGPIGRGAVGTRVKTQGTGLTVAAAFGQVLARIVPLFGGKQEKDVITVTPPELIGAKYDGTDTHLPEYFQSGGASSTTDEIYAPGDITLPSGDQIVAEASPIDVAHTRLVTETIPIPSGSRVTQEIVSGPIGRGVLATRTKVQGYDYSITRAFGRVFGVIKPLFGGKVETDVIDLTPPQLTGRSYEGVDTKLPDYYQVAGSSEVVDDVVAPGDDTIAGGATVIAKAEPLDVDHSRLVVTTIPTPSSTRTTTEKVTGPIGRGAIGTRTFTQGSSATITGVLGLVEAFVKPLFGGKVEKQELVVTPPALEAQECRGVNTQLPDYYKVIDPVVTADTIVAAGTSASDLANVVSIITPVDKNHSRKENSTYPTPETTRLVNETAPVEPFAGVKAEREYTQGNSLTHSEGFGIFRSTIRPLIGGKDERIVERLADEETFPWINEGVRDDNTGAIIEIGRKVVEVGTELTGLVSGYQYEYKGYDKWHSIQLRSKIITAPDTREVPIISSYPFPDELTGANLVGATAYGIIDGVTILEFDLGLDLQITEGYSGPCKARYTESYHDTIPDPVDPETFFPQAFQLTTYGEFSSVGSKRVGTISARVLNFPVPLVLSPGFSVNYTSTYISATLNIPATTPTALPHGAWIVKEANIEMWRLGKFVRRIVEVYVP